MSDPSENVTTFDGARYRQVLGHFPTGVSVVTAVHEGRPVGMAVGSFTSLSLEPPQVLFCAALTSSTWPKIREVGRFCVNILHEDQEGVSRAFASAAADKFEGLGWKHGANGAPVLDGVLAHIECDVGQVVTSGDHDICVGEVTALDVDREGGPLVFFRGGYGGFGR